MLSKIYKILQHVSGQGELGQNRWTVVMRTKMLTKNTEERRFRSV